MWSHTHWHGQVRTGTPPITLSYFTFIHLHTDTPVHICKVILAYESAFNAPQRCTIDLLWKKAKKVPILVCFSPMERAHHIQVLHSKKNTSRTHTHTHTLTHTQTCLRHANIPLSSCIHFQNHTIFVVRICVQTRTWLLLFWSLAGIMGILVCTARLSLTHTHNPFNLNVWNGFTRTS